MKLILQALIGCALVYLFITACTVIGAGVGL